MTTLTTLTTINGIDLTTITKEELTTLNLKNLQAIAKNFKVKNWWTMKKADIIMAVSDPIAKLQDTKTEKKTRKSKKTSKTEQELENLVTIKELASEFGMKPTKARRILRSSFGLATTSDKTRWEWDKNSEELTRVRTILHDKITAK